MSTTNEVNPFLLRRLNCIRRCFVDDGNKLPPTNDLNSLFAFAVNQILEDHTWDRMEHCPFDRKKQEYSYDDNKGYRPNGWGEIFDFRRRYSKSDNVYFKPADNPDGWTPVGYMDTILHPKETYIFVYERIVDTDGQVIALYEYL